MKTRCLLLPAALLFLIAFDAGAQDCQGGTISCNESKNQSLEFANNICLDANTLRFHRWPVQLFIGQVVDITAQSAFFPPRIRLIRPDNIVAASDSNPSGTHFATISSVSIPETGDWLIEVSSSEVAVGGPYTLTVICNAPTPPPPPPPPPPLTASASPSTFRVTAGDVVTTTVRTKVRDGFASSVSLQPVDVPSGVSVTVEPSTIPHPGEGKAQATITVGALANGIYNFGIRASGGGREFVAPLSLIIQTACDPPFLLSNQPRGQTVYVGGRATLVVDPSGTAPMEFQWYRGHSGLTFGKIDGATSLTYVTDPLYEDQSYWVRIQNGCGTRDSITATVEVEAAPPRRRAVRRP